MQRIVAELFVDSVAAVVIDGTRLNESSDDFDLDCEFTLRCVLTYNAPRKVFRRYGARMEARPV